MKENSPCNRLVLGQEIREWYGAYPRDGVLLAAVETELP